MIILIGHKGERMITLILTIIRGLLDEFGYKDDRNYKLNSKGKRCFK